MASTDAQMELEQQQLLIEQLKALVRERDDALQNKEKELQDTNAKLSKLRLQAKAKAVKKSQQAEAKPIDEENEKDPSDSGESREDGSFSSSSQAGRAKTLLLKRKLEEKDRLILEKEEVIKVREDQLEAKGQVLAEKDSIVQELKEQLEEKTKAMELIQQGGGGDQGQVQEMYAQMVYKDRKIMELNNKILEQDKRVMDLQEFAGEKDQVIRARDKVVEVLQNSIREKDQAVNDHAQLIAKLTSRVETSNEKIDEVTESLHKKENELKSETDRFHIKLTESQKYFEEMLNDMESEAKRLRGVIEEKDKELSTRENDLRALISKHERDIETLMKKENIDLHDQVFQMMENKLKDTNEVLEGKIQVIAVLQKELATKEHELLESKETQKLLKERLQGTSEQIMLLQANFVDMETQWKEERLRLEGKVKDVTEKHEAEISEKDLQVQTLQNSLRQYEAAYNQASVQYSRLQEHYQQALAGVAVAQTETPETLKDGTEEKENIRKELTDAKDTISKLTAQISDLESTRKPVESEGASSSKGDAKMLKAKAQMTSKIKTLEKELAELKSGSSGSLSDMKLKVKELEEEKGNLQQKVVEFEEKQAVLEETKAQLAECQIVIDTVHEEKDKLQNELDEALKEKDALNQSISRLQESMNQGADGHLIALEEARTALKTVESEREELCAKVEEIKKHCDDLELEREESNKKMDELAKKITTLEEEEGMLRQELERKKEEIASLESQGRSLEVKMVEIEEQRAGSERATEDLHLEIQHLKQTVEANEELKERVKEVTSALTEEEAARKAKEQEIQTLTDKVDSMQTEIDKVTSVSNNLSEDIKQLHREKDDLEASLEANKSHSEVLQREKEDLTGSKQQVEEEMSQLNSDLAKTKADLEEAHHHLEVTKSEYTEQVRSLQAQTEALAAELAEKTSLLSNTTEKLSASNSDLKELKNSLDESKDKCSDQELLLNKLRRELEVSRQGQSESGKEFEEKSQSFLTQISELEAELTSRLKLSEEQTTNISELTGALKSKEDDLKSVQGERDELKMSLESMQSEMKTVSEKLKSVSENFDSEKKAKEGSESDASRLSCEVASLKEHIEEKDAQLQAFEEEKNKSLSALQSDLESANSHIEKLKSIVDSKDCELSELKENCQKLQEQVSSISSELDASTTKLSEFKDINSSLQNQISEYDEKLSCMSQSLEEDSHQAQQVIEKLREERETQDVLAASLERQLISLEAEFKATREVSLEKDVQVSLLQTALADEEGRNDSLHSVIVQHQREQVEKDEKFQPKTVSSTEAQAPIQEQMMSAKTVGMEYAMPVKREMPVDNGRAVDAGQQLEDVSSSQVTISSLETRLAKVEDERNELAKILKKKEKVIQGLHLKAKKSVVKPAKVHTDGEGTENIKQFNQLEASVSIPSKDLSCQGSFDELNPEYQSLAIEKDALKDLLSEKDTEIVRLQTQFYDAELHWKELREGYEKDLASLSKKVQDNGQGTNTLTQANLVLEEEVQALNTQLRDASMKLEKSFQSEEMKDKAIKDLHESLNESIVSVQAHQEDMNQLRLSLDESEAQIQQLRKELERSQDEYASIENQLVECRETSALQLNRLHAEIKELHNSNPDGNQRSISDQSHMDEEKTSLILRYQELEHSLFKEQEKIKTLHADLADKDQKISVMEDVMKEMYGTQDENSTRIGELTSELTQVKRDNELVQSQLVEMKKTLKKRDAKITALLKRVNASTPTKEPNQNLSVSETDTSITEEITPSDASPTKDVERPSQEQHRPERADLHKAEILSLRKLMKKKDAQLLSLNKKIKNFQSEQDRLSVATSQESMTSERASIQFSRFDSRSTLYGDDVQELTEKLQQSEMARDTLETNVRDVEVKLDTVEEENLSLRHNLEDVQEEVHFLAKDKRALENCLFDIRDIVDSQLVEQFAGEDFLYSTAESVRLMVEEKSYAEKQLAETQAWLADMQRENEHLSEMKSSVPKLEQDLEQVTQKCNEAWAHLEQTIKAKASLEEEAEHLRTQISKTGSPEEVVEMENHLCESTLIIKTLKEDMESLKMGNDNVKEQLATLHASHDQVVQEKIDLENQLHVVSQKLTQVEEEKDTAMQQFHTNTEQISKLQNTQQASEDYIGQMQMQMKNMEEFYMKQNEELSNKFIENESQSLALKEENNSLKERIEEQDDKAQMFQSNLDSLNIIIQDLQQQKDKDQTTLSQDLGEARLKVDDLRTLLKNKEMKCTTLQEQQSDLAVQYDKKQKELETAHQKMMSLQEQISSFQGEVTQYKEHCQNLQDHLSYQQQLVTQLQHQCDISQGQLAQQQELVQQLSEEAREAKEELVTSQKCLEQLHTDNSSLKEELEDKKNQLRAQTDTSSKLEENLNAAATSNTEMIEIQKQLQQQLYQVQQDKVLTEDRYQMVSSDMEVKEKAVQELEERVVILSDKAHLVDVYIADITALKQDLDSKDKIISAHEQQISALQDSSPVESLTQMVNDLQLNLNQQQSEEQEKVGKLEEQIASLQGHLEAVSADKQNSVTVLQQQIDGLVFENQNLKTQNSEQAKTLQDMELGLSESLGKIGSLQQELGQNHQTIANCNDEIQSLKQQLSQEMENGAMRLKSVSDSLENEQQKSKDLFSNVESLTSFISEKDAELASLTEHNGALNTKLMSLSDMHECLEKSLSEIRDQYDMLHKQNEQLQVTLGELELENTNLKQQIQESIAVPSEAQVTDSSSLASNTPKVEELVEKMKAQQKTMKKKDAKLMSLTKRLEASQLQIDQLKEQVSNIEKQESATWSDTIVPQHLNVVHSQYEQSQEVQEHFTQAKVHEAFSPMGPEAYPQTWTDLVLEDQPRDAALKTQEDLQETVSKFNDQPREHELFSEEPQASKETNAQLRESLSELQSCVEKLEREKINYANKETELLASLQETQSSLMSMEEKFGESHKKLQDFSESRALLENQIISLEGEKENMSKVCEELEEKLRNKDQQQLEEQGHFEKMVSDLQELWQNSEMEKAQLQKQLQESQYEAQVKNSLEDQMNAEKEEMSKEVAFLRQELLEEKEKQATSVLEAEDIALKEEKYLEQIEALSSHLAERESQDKDLSELNEKWREGEAERVILLEKIASLQSFESKCVELEADNVSLNSRLHESYQLLEAAKKDMENVTEEKAAVVHELKVLYEQSVSSEEQQVVVVALQKKAEEKELLLTSKQAELDEVKQALAEKESGLNATMDQLHTVTMAKENLSQELEAAIGQVSGKDQKIQSLLENMQEMEMRLVQLEDQGQESGQGVESNGASPPSEEIDVLKTSLVEKDKQLAEKELVAKKAIATAKKLKIQLTQTTKSVEDIKAELCEVSKEKEELKAKLDALEMDLSVNKQYESLPSQQLQVADFNSTKLEESQDKEERQPVEEMMQSAVSTKTSMAPPSGSGDLSLEMEGLRSQVATYQECCEQLQQQVQTLTNAVFEAESKLKQKQNEVEQLEEVKEGLKMTVNQVESSYQSLQDEMEKAQQEAVTTKEDMEKQHEILTEQANQWKTFLESVQQENALKDEKLQQLNSELQHLSQEKSDVNLLTSSLEEKDQKLVSLMSELEALQAAQMQEDQQMKELKHQLRVAVETIEELKTNAEEHQASKVKLSSVLSALQEEVEAKNKEISDLHDLLKLQKTEFEIQQQGLQSQLSGLDEQVEDYKNRIVEMTSLLDSAQQAKEEELSNTNTLKEQLQNRNKEVEDMNEVVDSLKSQMEETKTKAAEEVDSLTATLQEFQNQVEDQRQLISELEQSINSKDSHLQVPSQESWDDLNRQLSSYQNMVEELNHEIVSLKESQLSPKQDINQDGMANISAHLDQALSDQRALENERDQLKKDLDNQLVVAKKMEAVVADKLTQVENVQASYERLQKVLAGLTSEKEQLLVDMDSMRGELEGMQRVVADTQLADSETREHLNAATMDRDRARNEVSNLQSQLAKMDAELTALKSSGHINATHPLPHDSGPEGQWQAMVEEQQIVVEESFQQAAAPTLSSQPHDRNHDDLLEKLRVTQEQYEKTKSRLQVSEVKCEKMLVKLKSFKDKNDKLQIQMDELQQAMALRDGGSPQRDGGLREERRRLEEQVSSLNAKLREVETHSGQLFHENSSLKNQLKELEASSANQAKSVTEMTSDLCAMTEDLKNKQDLIDALTKECSELKREAEAQESLLAARDEELERLKGLAGQPQEERASSKTEPFLGEIEDKQEVIENLRRELDNRQQAITHLETVIAGKEQEKEQAKVDAEAQLSFALEQHTNETARQLTSVHEDLDKEKADRKAAEDQIDGHVREKAVLLDDLNSLKEEVDRLEKIRQAEKERADAATERVRQMQDEFREEQLKRAESTDSNALQEAEISTLTSQLESLRSQYDTLSSDNAEYQELVSSLTKTNTGLRREVDELKFKMKKAAEESEPLTGQYSSNNELMAQLEDVQKERDDLLDEFEGVREELVALRREKTALTQQVSDLTHSVESLNAQISTMSNQLPSQGSDQNSHQNDSVKDKKDKEANDSRIELLEGELKKLKEELSDSTMANQQLKNEVNGLTWKLEEMSALEQDLEEAQGELASAQMEKKILSHDLEEAHGELSALQTDKHLLMKEVERLSELMESGTYVPATQGNLMSSKEHGLAMQDSSVEEVHKLVEEKTLALAALQDEMERKEDDINQKSNHISYLEQSTREQQRKLDEMEGTEQRFRVLKGDYEILQIENQTLKKKVDSFNLKIDTVKSLEADFDSLNHDFTKVLEEKSQMACQIEELHGRIQGLMSQEHELTFNAEHQEHVQREKETLQRRVEELEGMEGNSLKETTRLQQELDQALASLQQAEFEKKSVHSQLQMAQAGGGSGSKFHQEHITLQNQFAQVMEQKNGIGAELNQVQHTLKQSQARCQQQAVQISQLAEDRSYLNTQLANISKSLREKEQEWLGIRQQFGELYQAYIASQAKTAELERRIALDSMQKDLDDQETAAEADQVRVESNQTANRLSSLQNEYQNLEEVHAQLSSALNRERTWREKLQKELGEAQDQIKVLAEGGAKEIHIELEDDEDDTRIRETTTMLTRQGQGYYNRVQSWLRTKNRQLSRAMRMRPGLRTVIWIYFIFLHMLVVACIGGVL